MMTFLLGNATDFVDEVERLGEILERIQPFEMTILIQRPAPPKLLQHFFRLCILHGRDTAPARHALVISQRHNDLLTSAFSGNNIRTPDAAF